MDQNCQELMTDPFDPPLGRPGAAIGHVYEACAQNRPFFLKGLLWIPADVQPRAVEGGFSGETSSRVALLVRADQSPTWIPLCLWLLPPAARLQALSVPLLFGEPVFPPDRTSPESGRWRSELRLTFLL
jgi:hypothetical protein